MLVVLASAFDEVAAAVVAAWAPWQAALCVPADLSVPGWRLRVGAPRETVAVVGGRVTPVATITGVLTRLWHVQPEELTHIAAPDRAYVAAEMTAFLTAFLCDLRCPVLNRPSAALLSGPGWRPEQWIRAAIRAGIPVRPARRIVRPDAAAEHPAEVAAELTVIGGRVFGTADPVLRGWAKTLAAAAGTGLLGVRFARHGAGYVVAGVNPWPVIMFPGGLDAVRDALLGEPGATVPQ
ncbi:MAG TPA: hypothetical protein VND19_09390 [Acetobacteraceae bacterium]|nr:hypothetical protein [Acetobacteraceae bacterium]